MHALAARFVVTLLLVLAAAAPAAAIVVTPGLLPYEEELAAARFRKFNDPAGFELFVGVHTPAPASGRDVSWDLAAPNTVSVGYAPGADALSAGVSNAKPGSPFNQTFAGYSLAAVPPNVTGDFVPADMNVMIITLTLESTMPASAVSFEGVTLDGNPLGDFVAAGVGVHRWTVTDFDFGAGFALAGALKISGPFSGCDECSKLEISVGHLNVCGDGDIDPAGAFGTAEDCEDGNAVGGDCCSANCQYESAGGPCPDDGSVCSSDLCDGAGVCLHAAANAGAICRTAAGVCDLAETCSGVSPTCPADAKSGAVCRAAAGTCDVAENCDGVGNTCPANAFQPDGTPCSDASVCTTGDQCGGGACAGGAPLDCDDGSACTVDSCHPVDGCASSGAGPAPGCRTAAKSVLVVSQSGTDGKDKLVWRWARGQSTDLADFADPLTTADYSLCLYDGGALVARAEVAHGAIWKSLGAKGFKYKDGLGSQDGILKLLLRTSTANTARIGLKGKGNNLPDPVLPFAGPVVVQLVNDASDVCWESTFTTAKRSTDTRYKAKAVTP